MDTSQACGALTHVRSVFRPMESMNNLRTPGDDPTDELCRVTSQIIRSRADLHKVAALDLFALPTVFLCDPLVGAPVLLLISVSLAYLVRALAIRPPAISDAALLIAVACARRRSTGRALAAAASAFLLALAHHSL
jgi:hypothetical protein